MLVLCNFLKILIVSDKMILELIQLYKQNQLEKIFIFTIYQNYTLALTKVKILVTLIMRLRIIIMNKI